MYSINPALHSRAHRQFRGDSGPTHRFGPSGTHTHWLPAIREWHSVSRTLDRVFESLRVSQVTKLAVHPRLELLLESEPLAISQSEDQTAVHEGEVFAGVQSVLFSGTASRPTVSVSYIRRVHVSVAPELDIGSFRQSGLFLLSDDIHGFHVDMNGIVAEQAQDGVRRAQFG